MTFNTGAVYELVTVTLHVADTSSTEAVIVAKPTATAVTTPPSTEATDASDVLHTTADVVFAVVAVSVTDSYISSSADV